jgi:OmpA-OmpF porin, OOP family
MHKNLVLAAVASTSVATPALAEDAHWYIGVDAGVARADDAPVIPTGGFGFVPGPQVATSVESKTGYDLDAVFGRDLGHFRLEAEIGVKSVQNKRYNSAGFTAYPTAGGGFGVIGPGSYGNATGSQSVLSLMANAMVDVGKDKGVRFSAGGGIGVARVKETLGLTTVGPIAADKHTGFAWQLLAGVSVPVSEHVELGVKYRYFNADKVKIATLVGTEAETRFRSHSVSAGFTYKFF